SPVPPTHGSNPACTLVRYHDRWAYPRRTASSKNSRTAKLIESTGVVRPYEMTFQPVLPYQTSQVAPARFTVSTREPIGWIEPTRLSQTMISAPVFCPSVRGVGSNHRSYEAL